MRPAPEAGEAALGEVPAEGLEAGVGAAGAGVGVDGAACLGAEGAGAEGVGVEGAEGLGAAAPAGGAAPFCNLNKLWPTGTVSSGLTKMYQFIKTNSCSYKLFSLF